MGSVVAVTLASLGCLVPQDSGLPPALPSAQALAEVVLADDADPVPLTSFGLGGGGLDVARRTAALRWTKNGCTTPGHIRVQVMAAGVKLTFPSGCELLVAPDGTLHLRSGDTAGPFPSGLELRLGDGSSVRIRLSQAQRARLRDVVVVSGGRALQPWRRGRPASAIPRVSYWGGVRLCCCGDGGHLYRAIAIGSLVTLERVLVPADQKSKAPRQRLVILTAPLKRALAMIPRQSRGPDPVLRRAVRAVSATAARSEALFPAGALLHRADRDKLRWVLRAGYELELAVDGPRAPRLSLFAGRSLRPMVEWTLGAGAAAFLNNPRADQPGAPRWSGNGVRMPLVAAELQVRRDLSEHSRAIGLIGRLLDR